MKAVSNQGNKKEVAGGCLARTLDELVFGEQPAFPDSDSADFKILSKPRAQYTDIARQNQVTGTMRVRVTFLSSGKVGSVMPINSLPDGLTEQAICAARKIRFQPAFRNRKFVNATKIIEYQFHIF